MLRKLLITGIGALGLTNALAQAPTAYNTAITNYVYVGAAGLNASTQPTKIYTTASASSPSFTGGTTITGVSQKLNGFGLCQQDGYLYGMTFPNAAAVSMAKMYRVGSNGVAVGIGTITAPSSSTASFSYINTTAGMVDANGTYWMMGYTYDGNPNVVPYSANQLHLFLGSVPGINILANNNNFNLGVVYQEYNFASDPVLLAAMQSFLNSFNYANPGASNGGMEDLGLRVSNGHFYSYFSYPNPSNTSQLLHRPVEFDPSTFTLQVVGTVANSSPNREIAGAYFDAADQFYVLFTNAQYASVNLTTGALGALTTQGLPMVSTNLRGDLASNLPGAIPADPAPIGD